MRLRPVTLLPILWGLFLLSIPLHGQEGNENGIKILGNFSPLQAGLRLDDNVFRSTMDSGVVSDLITSVDFGYTLSSVLENWRAELRYEGGGDSYTTYDILDNFRNDGVISIDCIQGAFQFYFEKELYLTTSHYDDFNYIEDGLLLGVQWNPANPINLELKYKNLSREYGNQAQDVWSQNFLDNSLAIDAHLEMDNRLTLGAEGTYANRQYNRYALVQADSDPASYVQTGYLQTDQNYGILLSAQVYIESILQNLTIQHQRTDSNCYGFSNTVDSFSWAAVVRPVKNFYLQLFVRLFAKTYDQAPLIDPFLQVGFTDEDSQDLLSAKVTWEIAPGWSSGFTYSRMKNESTQPGEYYIKNVEAFQIERKF